MEVAEKDIRMAAMESLDPGHEGGAFPNEFSNVLRVRRYEERGRSARRYSPGTLTDSGNVLQVLETWAQGFGALVPFERAWKRCNGSVEIG